MLSPFHNFSRDDYKGLPGSNGQGEVAVVPWFGHESVISATFPEILEQMIHHAVSISR
jgi:hypothetical protein